MVTAYRHCSTYPWKTDLLEIWRILFIKMICNSTHLPLMTHLDASTLRTGTVHYELTGVNGFTRLCESCDLRYFGNV